MHCIINYKIMATQEGIEEQRIKSTIQPVLQKLTSTIAKAKPENVVSC